MSSNVILFDSIKIPNKVNQYGGRARWKEYNNYCIRCAIFQVSALAYDMWVRHHRDLATLGAFTVAKRMRTEGYSLRDALALCTGRVHK